MVDIVPHGVFRAADGADTILSGELVGDILFPQDDIFDLLLQVVGQLVAVAGEDLNAVVLKGVVGGGDHHAGVSLILLHQVCHSRCGHHAQGHHAGANAAQARRHSRFQHIGREPRILANEHPRVPVGFVCKHFGSCPAQLGGQFTGQVLIGNAADAVCSKQSSHNRSILPSGLFLQLN